MRKWCRGMATSVKHANRSRSEYVRVAGVEYRNMCVCWGWGHGGGLMLLAKKPQTKVHL